MDDALVATALAWHADVLEDYESASLEPVATGRRGVEVQRTLVRRIEKPTRPRAVVLHVHGRNDYFFHTELADAFAAAGGVFYAVDMRRGGRSLRDGEAAHHIGAMSELVQDIADAAAAAMADAPGDDLPLIVHAHSTGALAAALWANDDPHPQLAGVVLNGPLFGLRLHGWKKWGMHAMPAAGRVIPERVILPAPSAYSVHLLADNGGRWTFDTTWKRPGGEPVTAGWLGATYLARRRVRRGLQISVPVLVARSAQSGPDKADNPLLDAQDTVVDVDAIAAYAPGLGPRVEELVVDGAVHDLSLSAPEPRQRYFDGVADWMERVLA